VANYWHSGLGGLGIDLFSGRNGIVPIRIWQSGLHESCRNMSPISTKKKMSLFGLLEPEIWTEH